MTETQTLEQLNDDFLLRIKKVNTAQLPPDYISRKYSELSLDHKFALIQMGLSITEAEKAVLGVFTRAGIEVRDSSDSLEQNIFDLAKELKDLTSVAQDKKDSSKIQDVYKRLQQAITAYKSLELREGSNEALIASEITRILQIAGLDFQREEKKENYPDWIEEITHSNEARVYLHRTSEDNALSIMETGFRAGVRLDSTTTTSGSDKASAFENFLRIHKGPGWVVIMKIPQEVFNTIKANQQYNVDHPSTATNFMEMMHDTSQKPENIDDFLMEYFFDRDKQSIIIPSEWIYGIADQRSLKIVRNPNFNLRSHQDIFATNNKKLKKIDKDQDNYALALRLLPLFLPSHKFFLSVL